MFCVQYPQARAGAKKFRKVTLTVSPKGIVITDTETTDLIENVSIYRYGHRISILNLLVHNSDRLLRFFLILMFPRELPLPHFPVLQFFALFLKKKKNPKN